jgi:hypothetical protein
VPTRYIGLLGLVPLWMGLVKYARLLHKLYKRRRRAIAPPAAIVPADAMDKGVGGARANNGSISSEDGFSDSDSDVDLECAGSIRGKGGPGGEANVAGEGETSRPVSAASSS